MVTQQDEEAMTEPRNVDVIDLNCCANDVWRVTLHGLATGSPSLMTSHDRAAHVEHSIRVIEPKQLRAAGNPPKMLEEFVGRVASGDSAISIARMKSPSGWIEPPQTPDFDEYTVVLLGELRVESEGRARVVRAGHAVCVRAGVRVQYSTPAADGAEYIAICIPAFSPAAVHRERP